MDFPFDDLSNGTNFVLYMLVHFPENLVKILHYGRSYVLSIDIWKVIMEDFTFTTENSSLAEYLLKKKSQQKAPCRVFSKKINR
jgi:hypothetical protein